MAPPARPSRMTVFLKLLDLVGPVLINRLETGPEGAAMGARASARTAGRNMVKESEDGIETAKTPQKNLQRTGRGRGWRERSGRSWRKKSGFRPEVVWLWASHVACCCGQLHSFRTNISQHSGELTLDSWLSTLSAV